MKYLLVVLLVLASVAYLKADEDEEMMAMMEMDEDVEFDMVS
jgi:hypothetical protein